jgi:hypothetical protein
MVTGQRGTRRTDGVDPVTLGAANALNTADLDDILARARQRLG